MSASGRKNLKRKLENDDDVQKRKVPKEEGTESISVAATEALHLSLVTLSPEAWQGPLEENHEDQHGSKVSQTLRSTSGTISRGTMWRGRTSSSQAHHDHHDVLVSLGHTLVPNGSRCNSETQTYHFNATVPTREVVVSAGDNKEPTHSSPSVKDAKVEMDPDQEDLNLPYTCSVRNCSSHSDDTDASVSFYRMPSSEDQHSSLASHLNIRPKADMWESQYVCSNHFITPSKLTPAKTKTRKKKTFDMMLAEEAEKIKKDTTAGRPKRRPKPNKNYNWAELGPIIKMESEDNYGENKEKAVGAVPGVLMVDEGARLKEDKENERPQPQREAEEEVEGDQEYGQDVSKPSQPRNPPPKSKGRPCRIMDNCCQTEEAGWWGSGGKWCQLREVKVQCNLTPEPSAECSVCSVINWNALEEALLECVAKVSGPLCDPVVLECLMDLVDPLWPPSHASNVLRLLLGLDPQLMPQSQESKEFVVVSSQDDDEVEIENVIHPAVILEEPMTGMTVLTPKPWSSKVVRKVEVKEEPVFLEEDPDGFGLQEATEKDDEEFQPGFLEGDESEEELEEDFEDQDNEWSLSRRGTDSKSIKRKQKRAPAKAIGKGQQCLGRVTPGQEEEEETVQESGSEHEAGGEHGSHTQQLPETHTDLGVTQRGLLLRSKRYRMKLGKQRRKKSQAKQDDRWLRGVFSCSSCEEKFSTRLKMEQHNLYMHHGIPPWKGSHLCEECGKTFTQKQGLRVHRMHKHGDPKQFLCHLCSYAGVTKGKLKRHLQSHSDEKCFTCEYCGASLKSSETYKNHMTLHTNQGRYVCHVCKKAFEHKQYYKDHLRTHFETREFDCAICHTAFKTSKTLRTHMRAVHLNDKRIVCHVCGARFMTNFNLRGHMKKHARGEVPPKHQCSTCFLCFLTQQELAVHKQQEHSKESLQIKLAPQGSPAPITVVCQKLTADAQLLEAAEDQIVYISEAGLKHEVEVLQYEEDQTMEGTSVEQQHVGGTIVQEQVVEGSTVIQEELNGTIIGEGVNGTVMKVNNGSDMLKGTCSVIYVYDRSDLPRTTDQTQGSSS